MPFSCSDQPSGTRPGYRSHTSPAMSYSYPSVILPEPWTRWQGLSNNKRDPVHFRAWNIVRPMNRPDSGFSSTSTGNTFPTCPWLICAEISAWPPSRYRAAAVPDRRVYGFQCMGRQVVGIGIGKHAQVIKPDLSIKRRRESNRSSVSPEPGDHSGAQCGPGSVSRIMANRSRRYSLE